MRVFSVAGIILLVVAVAQSGLVRRDVDDVADSEDVTESTGIFFEDEDGNLVEVTDGTDDETVAETEASISERVFFHLYTQSNPTTSQELVIGDSETLGNSNWDASKLTRIVTHGWLNSHESEACTSVRDAYLENGDHNVIVVDWSAIAKSSYGFAVRRVTLVAAYIAQMIDFLESQGMDISQLVVVGHSLGGHIAGISSLKATNTVGYVVALDPAGPFFWLATAGNRVDVNDAANVQVIHTNAGKLGLTGALGDIDFYPNGGVDQLGCTLDVTGACAHSRAYEYFAESINSDAGFWGQSCTNFLWWLFGLCSSTETAFMGGNVPTAVAESGYYFFWTASSSAYALGSV